MICSLFFAQIAYAGQLVNLGGFEEGDLDGNGVADSWISLYPEMEVSGFADEGSYSQKISLVSIREQDFMGGWEDWGTRMYLEKYVYSLQSNVDYDFVLDFYPDGSEIDDISNFHYELLIGITHWDSSGVASGDYYYYTVGSTVQLDQWNRITISKNYSDITKVSVYIRTDFERIDDPPPWEGEWTSHLYIDSPVPEPSMFFMILLALPFVSRRVFH
jgi:hypothetical protein